MRKVILVLLVTSLVALQAPTTAGQELLFTFMSKVLTTKSFFELGFDFLKNIGRDTKEAEDEDDTPMLLERIKKNVDGLREDLNGNFTAIFANIDRIPGTVWATSVKESFQNVVDEIGDVFEILAEMQIQTNQDTAWISESDTEVVANYETDLMKKWRKLQHYLFDGKIMDLLKKKEANDVCQTGISHLQLLERSLDQYMSLAIEYMSSQHIIYNIREYVDKKNKNGNRKRFNEGLQKTLERGLNKIKTAMKECSTEYWLCDPVQEPITSFMLTLDIDGKEGSSDCEDILNDGYQCIPFHNNHRKCDCLKSTMNISLVWAKADPDYVITGAQMKIERQVLSIVANQAKLLPNGEIDKTTVKAVTSRKEIGKSLTAEFVIKRSTMRFGKVEIPQNRFMTAVGFQQNGAGSFHIGAESMKYDNERKTLVTNDVRLEQYRESGGGTTFARAVNVKKDSNGRINDAYWDNRINPLVDTRMVQSASPGPLSGVGLFLRGKSEEDGYVAIKINTYNIIPLIPKIPSLIEFPIQDALESLSNSTSLIQLEQKFEKL